MPTDISARRTGSEPEILQAGERRSARVESLRAIAALSVLVAHAWMYAHGFGASTYVPFLHRIVASGALGVQLFFALSGYLIFRPFARRDFGGGGPINLRSYAFNRALRILPLYWFAVVVLLVLTQHGGSSNQWWRFGLFAETFSRTTAQTVDGPMWSVVVEIHFYILLPLIAWVLAGLSQGRRWMAGALLIGAGAISVLFQYNMPHPAIVWTYSLPSTFYGFVPGMLLALLQIGWEERPPAWLRGPLASRDAWIAASILVWVAAAWYLFTVPPLTAAAAFLTVGAVVLPLRHEQMVRVLDSRPLALLGVASYSLYMWHVPIMAQLTKLTIFQHDFALLVLVALPAALLTAAISYFVVERPALRQRRRWSTSAAPKLAEAMPDVAPEAAAAS